MNVIVACDHHFERSPDGTVWAHGPLTHSFWSRYLPVFEKVRLVARVREIAKAPSNEQPASGDGVEFIRVPDFTGPQQFMLRRRSIMRVVGGAIGRDDAVILRAPTPVGNCLLPELRRTGRPFGMEVVGDPFDSFSANAVKHPLRRFFRWMFVRNLRNLCQRACGVSYVTQHALQRRYPPAPDAFSTHYSSIDLPASSFVIAPRTGPISSPARLLLVGTLAGLYKAPDVLIDAVALCASRGLPLKLTIVGGGVHQQELQARAAAHGLNGAVKFTGNLSDPAAVREQLDETDLYVMPSRQEGLPRALIEAMARGLPAISSTVGGIPELLPAEDLIPPNDVEALAAKIAEVLADPARLARESARNLVKAREYCQDVLTPRRIALYSHIRGCTERWLQENSKLEIRNSKEARKGNGN